MKTEKNSILDLRSDSGVVTFSAETKSQGMVTISINNESVTVKKVALDNLNKKVQTLHKDPADIVDFKAMFSVGLKEGREAGKNDAMNNLTNLDLFSDENRDLKDGYQLGFELGYMNGTAEFNFF